jgi:hypothetical protein
VFWGCTAANDSPLGAGAPSIPPALDGAVLDGRPPSGDASAADTPVSPPPADASRAPDAAPDSPGVPACAPGSHRCGDSCLPDTAPASCGQNCAPCTVPEHASATCGAGQVCGWQCNPSFHGCGSGCVADDDVEACGTGCVRCSVLQDQVTTCAQGSCQHACIFSCPESAGGCARAAWDFESPDQSAALDTHLDPAQVTTTRAHGGIHSVVTSTPFNADVPRARAYSVQLRICAGNANLDGRTLSGWVRLDGPPIDPAASFCKFGYMISEDRGSSVTAAIPPAGVGSWFEVSGSISLDIATSWLALTCFVVPPSGDGWTGTMYIDDVTVH